MDERRFDYANLANLAFIEQLYTQYLEDPKSVDGSWQRFFEGMAFGSRMHEAAGEGGSVDLRIFNLIEAYRTYGHLAASFNPLSFEEKKGVKKLDLNALGFKQEELSQLFPTYGWLSEEMAPLSHILKALQQIYCGFVGFEFKGLQNSELEDFIQKQIEPIFPKPLSHEEKLRILHHLNISESFESFIHLKYPGQKRFSLEGGETLIPILREMINEGGEEGVETLVIGMAHRGRLNVLANILGKSYQTIFQEFEGNYIPDSFEGTGDVKYHKGFKAVIKTVHGKKVHIDLAANPSHLESVDPVVEGQVRALQEKGSPKAVAPLLIHGDAALAGQGVVYETIQLGALPGYQTGGTIHVVINNQVGFTATEDETRSTRYCTDLAKAFGAPVFHVNGEKPEACVAAARLAMQVRQKFHTDVFIELNCYRKYGHNETDEPAFTQPLLYQKIKKRPNIRDLYRDQLIAEGSLSKEEAEASAEEFKQILEKALAETKNITPSKAPQKTPSQSEEVKTGVSLQRLKNLASKFCSVPDGFNLHPKLKRLLEDRLRALSGKTTSPTIDWGMAETLAYATLLKEKVHIRLSGQDSGRGTFSHRHAILTDQSSQKKHLPLNYLENEQASFDAFNSPLSEYAVMGFEYGYSIFYEKALVIWEAQFGDFANGAQIMIDQYIVSGEQKWGNQSNLTLLLPHGYEGMGPEHSSARIERFLQLAAMDSFYIVVPSTAAQFYHALRRQGISKHKKPLILFSPKALLRFPPSYSAPVAFDENSTFKEVLEDPDSPKKAKKLLLCAGKVFYDLLEERKKRSNKDVAIVRIEQLYPFPKEKIEQVFKQYEGFESCIWVQEEHQNMGAWESLQPQLEMLLPEKMELRYAGRKRSASPAVGSAALHKQELAEFLNEAFEH